MSQLMNDLAEYGQSLWLDYIDRPLLLTDKLQRLIADGLRGMTSNPSIFQNAIGATHDYDDEIVQLKEKGKSLFEIYDALTIADIQNACDQFRGVYDATHRHDGYVSLEINPQLANQSVLSIAEGVRLFEAVARPNLMIKVPATPQGFSVIKELIGRGINVNVTLIFSRGQYEKTVDAYFEGLELLVKNGGNPEHVRSVASVFVSRVDSAVDKLLAEKQAVAENAESRSRLTALLGKAAVANCRQIFEIFKKHHDSEVFKNLFDSGAREQRVLWASTGTKNPEYSDIKYVTELIARPTVNTLPEPTLAAYCDHGSVIPAFQDSIDVSLSVIEELGALGVDMEVVCQKLLEDGVEAFNKAFESLFCSLEEKSKQLTAG